MVKPIWTLKIDKDCHVNKQWIEDYVHLAILTCQRYQIKVHEIRMCPSQRKGLHFYIDINPSVEPKFANRLQWLLGDDCRRVDFNRARISSGLQEWNKLFEQPQRRLRTIYRGHRVH
jgi:hypothetical protein